MDFDKLLEPYTENGRTIALQINWLLKKGIPQDAIDYAMSAVYKRIELGESFQDGNALDQELKKVALDHHKANLEEGLKKRIAAVEANLDTTWNSWGKGKKIWEVLRGRA